MMSFRTLRCEPRKLEGKLNVVRIGIRESKRACGEAVSCGSAVARSQTVVRTNCGLRRLRPCPNVIESTPDYAFWCFPTLPRFRRPGWGSKKRSRMTVIRY
jgi:hypothetical protein